MVLRLGLIKLNLQILRFPFPLYLWACLTAIQKQLTNVGLSHINMSIIGMVLLSVKRLDSFGGGARNVPYDSWLYSVS